MVAVNLASPRTPIYVATAANGFFANDETFAALAFTDIALPGCWRKSVEASAGSKMANEGRHGERILSFPDTRADSLRDPVHLGRE